MKNVIEIVNTIADIKIILDTIKIPFFVIKKNLHSFMLVNLAL